MKRKTLFSIFLVVFYVNVSLAEDKIENAEVPSQDENSIELYGIRSNKQRELLMTFNTPVLDTNIEWINPNTYVHLQLKLNSKDEIDRTPAQLKYWRIYYEDIGEVAVNNSSTVVPKMRDTIENGERMTLNFGAETLNTNSFDSISYKMTINQGTQSRLLTGKAAPMSGNSFQLVQRELSMDNYFENSYCLSFLYW